VSALHNEGKSPSLGTTAQKKGANSHKTPVSPSLTVGGGTPDRNIEVSQYQEPPTTIKEDFCHAGSCGSPWTIHHHPVALKMHIKSWFDYGKYGSIVNTYGPDFCNEVIQEYKNRWTVIDAKGEKVNNPGGFFKMIVDELLAGGEPRNYPNDVTKLWEGMTKERKGEDRGKYLDEYNRRRGKA